MTIERDLIAGGQSPGLNDLTNAYNRVVARWSSSGDSEVQQTLEAAIAAVARLDSAQDRAAARERIRKAEWEIRQAEALLKAAEES